MLSIPNFKLFCREDRKYTPSGSDLAVSLFRPNIPKTDSGPCHGTIDDFSRLDKQRNAKDANLDEHA